MGVVGEGGMLLEPPTSNNLSQTVLAVGRLNMWVTPKTNRPSFGLILKLSHALDSLFSVLLYTYQPGFWKKHSTDFCLSYLNDKILKGFDKGLITGMVLTDLQKAFDTTDHDVILQKLYAIGFSKYTVNWFQSCFIQQIING